MDPERQQRADRRFEEGLAATGARDPRDYYRTRLQALKDSDEGAYERAVAYYEETLIPSVADGEVDPLEAWMEFGCRLAQWSRPGTLVEIDPSGRAHPYAPPTPGDRMVLHLSDARNERALLVGLPSEPSAAQRATYDLLVQGRQKLRDP